jgi:hypothetical protein
MKKACSWLALGLLPATLFANPGVVVSSALNYGDGGWGGWSVPSGKVVTCGGFDLSGGPAAVSGPAQPNSVWPHYTFGANEYGWVVRDSPDGASSPGSRVYAIYEDLPAGYQIITTSAMSFGDGGWAGWSAPAGKVVLGGGFYATGPVSVSCPATPGTVWPHYTFGANEYGWVVRDKSDGASNTISIYVICADPPAGYQVVQSGAQYFSGTGWGGWSVPAGKLVTGGGFRMSSGSAAASIPGQPGVAYPHYTYGPSEHGWVVRAAGEVDGNPDYIYAIAVDPTPPYNFTQDASVNHIPCPACPAETVLLTGTHPAVSSPVPTANLAGLDYEVVLNDDCTITFNLNPLEFNDWVSLKALTVGIVDQAGTFSQDLTWGSSDASPPDDELVFDGIDTYSCTVPLNSLPEGELGFFFIVNARAPGNGADLQRFMGITAMTAPNDWGGFDWSWANRLKATVPGAAGATTELTVTLNNVAGAPDWYHYRVFIDYESSLTVQDVVPIFDDADLDGSVDNGVFGWNPNNYDGQLEVSYSYMGSTANTNYTGPLFKVIFASAFEDEDSVIDMVSAGLRERPYTDIAVSVGADEHVWIDCSATNPPTNLIARPRHQGVYLAWTPPSEAPAYYRIYRAPRTGYPWCPDVNIPGSGTYTLLATTIPGGNNTWTDLVAPRDVYDYKLVAVDAVQNASAMSSSATATNYFLGDWRMNDGQVNIFDLTALSQYYGTSISAGDCAAKGELDVAPTSDMSSFGLPSNHDGRINFEDLIIFAMNYMQTLAPLASGEFAVKNPAEAGADASASLTLSANADGVQLNLNGEVLGYSALLRTERELVSADVDGGVALYYRTADGYRVDVAGLGGLLPQAPVRLVFADEGPLSLVSAEGRSLSNGAVATSVGTLGGLGVQPEAYTLSQNVPNPFNPTTTIRYSLPENSQVRLALYNTLGQEVMTLVSGVREAGLHEVRLDGSGLASGVYVYRLEAGSFVDQKKLVLVK